MAIYQEDHRQGGIPSQVVAASLQPDSALDYPNRRSNTSSGSIVLVPPMMFTCRASDKVTYLQGGPPTGANSRGWQACRRAGGVVKVWRYPNPSPYGNYIFQTSCNGQIFADYNTRVAGYTASRGGGLVIARGLVILSVTFLSARLYRRLRHLRTAHNSTS